MRRGDGYCTGAFDAHLRKWRMMDRAPAAAPADTRGDVLIPNVLHSYEEAMRFYHEDLETLSDFQLWQEGGRILDALKYAQKPHPWLVERYKAIKTEQQERKQCQRR